MSVSVLGALSGAEPPPLSLPGSHFAVATGFLLAGGLGLLASAPDLAAGSFLSPRVTATTHLFTLGWITTSIMGALYQLLPVVLDRAIRWPGVARGTLVLHAVGLALFVAGLALQRPGLTAPAAAALALGLGLFVANLAATLKRAPRRDLTWWALVGAASFLALTVVVGAAMAVNLRWPFMGAARIPALASHIHIALAGWVGLVVAGVGHRLLPMFLLSHGASERPGRWAVGLLATGAALVFSLHHAPAPWPRLVAGPVLLAGAAALLVQARAFYRARRRPDVDPGMRLAAAALGVVGLGAALGAWQVVAGFGRPALATAYVAALVLGLSLFVAAHYYKIVPFLVWYHRFGPVAGRQPVPKVADLYSAPGATAATGLQALGVVALVGGVLWGAPGVVRTGAALFLCGAVVEAAQLAGVARRRPA
ncbi:MAG: hypothetical protein AMXMBFR53_30510 [Gemmatimonadota bacterium]